MNQSEAQDKVAEAGLFAENVLQEEDIAEDGQGESVRSELREPDDGAQNIASTEEPSSCDEPSGNVQKELRSNGSG
jgi:hypothetical protein